MDVTLEEKSLNLFRFSLLNMLLKIVFVFSFLVAVIASFDFLPLDENYEKLYFYGHYCLRVGISYCLCVFLSSFDFKSVIIFCIKLKDNKCLE